VSWEPLNLRALPDRPPVEPTIGGLVYPGRRHVFSGPPESAKTFAAFCIAVDELHQGATVLHVDFEMFDYETRDRLRAMGVTDEELDRFVHVEPDARPGEGILGDLVETWQPRVAIIDAAAGAYAAAGLDDHKRGDVGAFERAFIDPLRIREVATIVVDHVTKRLETRGSFAIGSERKIGAADVHLGFEARVAIGRGRTGIVKVTTLKDRFGFLPRPTAAELELRSDPHTHAVTWEFRAADDGDGWRPTVLMQKVSEYLVLTGDEVSRNDVESNVTGKAQYLREAMDALVADGFVSQCEGSRGARLLRSIRPFSSSSHFVPTSSHDPDEVPRPSSLPLKGDEDEDEVERLAARYADFEPVELDEATL
jgi:hypothetical protein